MKKFIEYMIKNDKVFTFYEAVEGSLAPTENNPINDIYDRSVWWKRDIDKSFKVIDNDL